MAGVRIEATPAYDVTPGESFHPKGEANGYIVTLGGRRIYVVGVTECVPEIRGAEEHRRRVLPHEPAGSADGAGRGNRVHQGDQPEGRLSVSLRSGLGAARAGRRHAARADDARTAGIGEGVDAAEDRSAIGELVPQMSTYVNHGGH